MTQVHCILIQCEAEVHRCEDRALLCSIGQFDSFHLGVSFVRQ